MPGSTTRFELNIPSRERIVGQFRMRPEQSHRIPVIPELQFVRTAEQILRVIECQVLSPLRQRRVQAWVDTEEKIFCLFM